MSRLDIAFAMAFSFVAGLMTMHITTVYGYEDTLGRHQILCQKDT